MYSFERSIGYNFSFMNPKSFLTLGGLVLMLVAALGFWGVIGPTPEASLFGEAWWFDNAENWAHLVIGIVGLAVAMWGNAMMQKWVTVLVGLFALVVTVSGYLTPGFLGANLENPADSILHLVVGVWALWSAKNDSMM